MSFCLENIFSVTAQTSHVYVCLYSDHMMSTEEREEWNREYMENIRLRLEEDSSARQQREMRRRRALVEQLKAHETQQVSITSSLSFTVCNK